MASITSISARPPPLPPCPGCRQLPLPLGQGISEAPASVTRPMQRGLHRMWVSEVSVLAAISGLCMPARRLLSHTRPRTWPAAPLPCAPALPSASAASELQARRACKGQVSAWGDVGLSGKPHRGSHGTYRLELSSAVQVPGAGVPWLQSRRSCCHRRVGTEGAN